MITLLALASLVIAVAFIVNAAVKENGMPESISSLVYDMKKKWVWSLWLLVTGLLALPKLLDSLPDMWKFFGFLMFIALVGTDLTPLYIKDDRKIHNAFCIVLGVLSQVCVAILSPYWLPLWVLFLPLMGMSLLGGCPKWLEGKGLFVIEMICMLTFYGSMFL